MTVFKILFGLIGLSLVVIIHEAGHFIAARLSGITVEAFSIGWGKVLFAKKWRGTEYRLSLFPLGGYCKMQGEQALIQAWENHAREVECQEGDMYAASFWKRIIVSLSGPFLNLLFAGLIFFTIAFIGYKVYYYPSRIVLASEYTARADYPADTSGLQTGDIITKINGASISRFDQLQERIALNALTEMTLTVDRQGKEININIIPELNKQSGAGFIGIYPWIDPRIRSLSEDSVFAGKGLIKGDTILTINGRSVTHAVEISSFIEKTPLTSMTIMREGSTRTVRFDEPVQIENPGIQFDFYETRTKSFHPFHSLNEAWQETARTLISSLKGLALLFKGVNLQSAVSGPLRITYLTGDLAFSGFQNGAAEGFLTFFRFIALINIALFVMNLLPIPVLDGGQILLFLLEGILGRRPNPQLIYRYQLLGTVIVFGLILFATMNDILFFSRN